jgi:hypothetical protein
MLKEIHAKYTFAEIILISKWFSEKAKNQTGSSISTAVEAIVFPIQKQGKWILRKHNNQNCFLLIFVSCCSNFEQ